MNDDNIVLFVVDNDNPLIVIDSENPNQFIFEFYAPSTISNSSVLWSNILGKPNLALDPHTQPASTITDLGQAIETETEPGNLVLWFENQLS
jgi:hypothetical protein